MRIEYTCEDGSKTVASWPSMALLHWLERSHPTIPIENPEPSTFDVISHAVLSDDDDIFLTLVYAAIERRWNKTPPFEIEPPNDKKKHGGKRYQDRCLQILKWIRAWGDISTLVISQES